MPHSRRRIVATERASLSKAHDHGHDYSALLLGVRAAFAAIGDHRRVFLTDAEGLNELYLDSLPQERQTHNCHACRRFIETYGALVAIGEKGEATPAMWRADGVPEFYQSTFAALAARVKRARVISVFLTKESVWGLPLTGEWSHMAVNPPAQFIYAEGALTAGQAMAAAKENYRTVAAALTEFKPAVLDQALRLLTADVLARGERFIAPVKWLRALHDRPKGKLGENILWQAVGTAPEGFCHPKASVIGPLLNDIAEGLPFDEIKVKFAAMLHPLRYQRPTSSPAAGNIKAAEALVEKLGIARSLERRFALRAEVDTVWRPEAVGSEAKPAGVFGHVKAKDTASVPAIDIPTITMTWEKFARTVLPGASRLDIRVPASGNFQAYLAAAHDDAPLIFKWENPFSAYVYHNGSRAANWGLVANAWAAVSGVSPRPNLWGDPQAFLGDGLLLIIENAADQRDDQGNALFPETLRADLHSARSTIEAYSKAARIGRPGGELASGYGIGKGAIGITLRVLVEGGWVSCHIDRWD